MTKKIIHKISLILDPVYGEKLLPLSKDSHVWAVNTEENRKVLDLLEGTQPDYSDPVLTGISFFDPLGESTSEWLVNALELIDDHHNEYRAECAWNYLVVYGLSLSKSIEKELQAYGFSNFQNAEYGFFATKN